MLGLNLRLEQAREGVEDVMRGRKKLKGKRRGGGEEGRSEKKRVMEKRQAAFMDSWTSSRTSSQATSRQKTDSGDKNGLD